MIHVYGDVACTDNEGTNWGCSDTSGGDAIMLNVLRINDDGTDDRIYPTSSTNKVKDIQWQTCTPYHDCTVAWIKMNGYSEDSSSLVYKDESNPFGDSTLTEKFTWKKKNEYLQAAGLYRASTKDQEVQKMQAKIREIQGLG